MANIPFTRKFSTISLLITLIFGLLLLLGLLVMTFGNFTLGMILFVLGLILMIANEALFLRNLFARSGDSSTEQSIASIFNYAIAGYLLPLAVAGYIYFNVEQDMKVVIIIAGGFIITTIKIVSKSLALFYSPKKDGL